MSVHHSDPSEEADKGSLELLKSTTLAPQETDPQPPESCAETTVTMETSATIEQSGQVEDGLEHNILISGQTPLESDTQVMVCFIACSKQAINYS